MQVKIKSFDVEMDVKNNGVEFQVHDNDGKFLGDVWGAKGAGRWCSGKTTPRSWKRVPGAKFIELMSD